MENTMTVNVEMNIDKVKKDVKKEILKLTLAGIVEVAVTSIVGSLMGKYLPQQTGFKGKAQEVGKYVVAGLAASSINQVVENIIDSPDEVEETDGDQ